MEEGAVFFYGRKPLLHFFQNLNIEMQNRQQLKPRKYTPRQRGPAIVCCGVELYNDLVGHYWHDKSVLHKNYRRILRYLEKDCMSFTEIGVRLGVSREFVRQIAGRLGVEKGHVRSRVCTVTRADTQWREALKRNALGRFIKQCEVQGLRWERVPTQGRWKTTLIFVESKLVKVRTASYNMHGFIQLHAASNEAEITAYELPGNHGWLLMSRERRVTHATSFSLHAEVGGKGWCYSARHDYPSMVNDWSVFGKAKAKAA